MNIVTIYGRLARDPSIKQSNSGKDFATFTIADDYGFGENKGVNFTDCVTFYQHQAHFLRDYFSKGDPIMVIGEMHTNKWTDKEGKTRSQIQLFVDKMEKTGGRNSASGTSEPEDYPTIEDEEDLPF